MRALNQSLWRYLPLRRLFGVIPNLLTQLKPCLLMSPQFLDPERTKFDLVIFDEASQLRSEDAICSVYRGKQLVVCGDNKQLPPTTFFERGMSEALPEESEDPNATDAFDVFECVLDAGAAVMPQPQLKWHYRSEHESLIAFSNCTFYDFSLVTFPSWLQEDEGLGVKFVHVPHGVYDRGGRRDNVREAERVVGLIEEHLRRFPNQSLGVVTFNITQADSVVAKLLSAGRAQLADELDGFELFEPSLRDANGGQQRFELTEAGLPGSGRRRFRAAGPPVRKCSKSLGNWLERGCSVSESRSPEWM